VEYAKYKISIYPHTGRHIPQTTPLDPPIYINQTHLCRNIIKTSWNYIVQQGVTIGFFRAQFSPSTAHRPLVFRTCLFWPGSYVGPAPDCLWSTLPANQGRKEGGSSPQKRERQGGLSQLPKSLSRLAPLLWSLWFAPSALYRESGEAGQFHKRYWVGRGLAGLDILEFPLYKSAFG
jgi:hypothetical protein